MTRTAQRSGEYACAGCGEQVKARDAIAVWADAPLGRTSVKAHEHCVATVKSSLQDRGWKLAADPNPDRKRRSAPGPMREVPRVSVSSASLDWEAISNAYSLVKSGAVARVDGKGWKVYAVRNELVRVDIDPTRPA